MLSNFIELNDKTVLDFQKKENSFKNIFLKISKENDSIIFSKKGQIISNNKNHIFNLIDGFKIDILDREIEKLEFNSYTLSIPKDNNIQYDNIDKNTQTLIDDLKNNNIPNILIKISDITIFIFIVIFYYKNNILKHNYLLSNNLKFIVVSIFFLILNQLVKNAEMDFNNLIIFISINLIVFLTYITFSKTK